jgi:hypothetical protein
MAKFGDGGESKGKLKDGMSTSALVIELLEQHWKVSASITAPAWTILPREGHLADIEGFTPGLIGPVSLPDDTTRSGLTLGDFGLLRSVDEKGGVVEPKKKQ